jgi:hypothetical protein
MEVLLYTSTGLSVPVEGKTRKELREQIFKATQELRKAIS